MGQKPNAVITKLDAEGHVFEREYDLYFNDCTNPRCRHSHDRAACINYFYTHPDHWFDYVVNAIKNRVPIRFIYRHFRPITTHDPQLINTIARYNKRPCFSTIDDVPCRNRRCSSSHNKAEIRMYYIYHPNVYLDDLVYKISKLDEREMFAEIEKIRPSYLSMLKDFDDHKIKPAATYGLFQTCNTSYKRLKIETQRDDDAVITSIINKITEITVNEYVEATNRYVLDNPDKIDSVITTICKLSASSIAMNKKMMPNYYAYVNGLHHSTVFTSKLQFFIEKTIEYIDIEWNTRYEQLSGHPFDYEFPDGNLILNEISNIIRYLLNYGSGVIYEHGKLKVIETINNCNKTENIIIAPYVLKYGKVIPKHILENMLESTKSLPACPYKSKLRFAIMDALEG